MAEENTQQDEGSHEEARRQRSDVWAYFIRVKTADGLRKAKCRSCQDSLVADSRLGTSHLWRHAKSCRGENAGPAATEQQIPPLATLPSNPMELANVQFDQEKACTELTRMISVHGYPLSIVEDEHFLSFVSCLNPDFKMPSRIAMEESCRGPADTAMNMLKETLEHIPGHINLSTGIAQTVQGRVLYMACHFIDDEWILHKRIMQAFLHVPSIPYHYGAFLDMVEVSLDLPEAVLEHYHLQTTSRILEEAIRSWGLLGKLFSVAWCEALTKHVVKKDFLEAFCPDMDPIRRFFGIPQIFCVTYTSDVLSSASEVLFNIVDLYYVRICYEAVKSLHLSKEKREDLFLQLGLDNVFTYDKKWYSYYCSLEVLHKEYSENPDLAQQSEFKESEFTELLRKILGAVYHAMKAVKAEGGGYSTTNVCLEEVFKLRAILQAEASVASGVISKAVAYAKIRGFARGKNVDAVLQEAQGILDSFLQGSFLYMSIPVVLDPRFKLEYITNLFKENLGPDAEAYTSRLQEALEQIFYQHKRKRCNNHPSGEGTSRMAGVGAAAMDVDSTSQESITELERYLVDGVVRGDAAAAAGGFDVLQWWKDNEFRYPTVARMARDALSMPSSDLLSPEHLSCIRSMVSNDS